MRLLLAFIDRWWDNRFHPTTHVGFNRIVRGWRRGRNGEVALGFGMLLFGLLRRRPSRRVFTTELAAGQGIGIRVVEGGEVVGDVAIPRPDR